VSRWRRSLAGALGSIKLRVMLSASIALALGVLLTTVLLVRQAERDTLRQQRDRELAATVRVAAELSRRVVERQKALQNSAVAFDRTMLDDLARLRGYFELKPLLRGMFGGLFVASADGQVRAYVDQAGISSPAIDLTRRVYFRRTVAERRSLVSEALASSLTGEPVVVFTAPLQDSEGVYGVLGGILQVSGRELLADLLDPGDADGGLTVVSDATGQLLAHPSQRGLLQPVSAEARLGHAHAQWLASGSPVEPGGLMLEQPGELVSAAGVAGPDWMVWRALPQSELLEPLHAARRQALAWAAGLIAALSLAMLALLFWLLRPLAQLEHRAQHLFDGRHDVHESWPRAGGEIGRLSRVLRHVSAERAQLEAFNGQVLKKLSSVMDAAPVGIAFTRAQRFELVSAEFCRLVGRNEHMLMGEPLQGVFASNEDFHSLASQARAAFDGGQAYLGEWQMLRADGSRFWAQLRARPVDAADGDGGTIWTLSDITEHVAAREQLEWSAAHDALTGLANRKAFDQRLTRALDGRPRTLPAELVMIDLDHFKPINDQFGHAAGDAMLKAVAAAITARVRASDLVARLGGDEFALLLESCSHESALRIAENVRRAIAAIELPWQQHALRVGASLGVASLAGDTPNVAAWLHAADAACYEAKAAGRSAVRTAARPALRVVGAAPIAE